MSSARNGFCVRQSAEVRKKYLYDFKYGDGFFYKSASIRYRKIHYLYSPPEPCEAHFIMDARALYFWTVEKKHPHTPILKFV